MPEPLKKIDDRELNQEWDLRPPDESLDELNRRGVIAMAEASGETLDDAEIAARIAKLEAFQQRRP